MKREAGEQGGGDAEARVQVVEQDMGIEGGGQPRPRRREGERHPRPGAAQGEQTGDHLLQIVEAAPFARYGFLLHKCHYNGFKSVWPAAPLLPHGARPAERGRL